MTFGPWVVGLAVALIGACGSDAESASPSANAGTSNLANDASVAGSSVAGNAIDIPYQPCAAQEAVGSFRVELAEDYTLVQGQVFDAVEPSQIPIEVMSDGDCRLLRPQVLLCEPACAFSTESCGAGGACQPLAIAHDLGAVTVSGLAIPVEMSPNERTQSYSNPATPPLPHPGFDAGADLNLQTAGGDYAPLALRGWGISTLEVTSDPIRVESGQPTLLEWNASSAPTPARLLVNLDINVHGSGGARIECTFPDTGTASIPAPLVDALIAEGLSGFPTAILTRQTVTSASIEPGCVSFSVASPVSLALEVSGLVSCNVDEDCPTDQTCLPVVRNCG